MDLAAVLLGLTAGLLFAWRARRSATYVTEASRLLGAASALASWTLLHAENAIDLLNAHEALDAGDTVRVQAILAQITARQPEMQRLEAIFNAVPKA